MTVALLEQLRTLAAGGRLVPPEAARGIAAGLVTLDELRRGQQALAAGLLEVLRARGSVPVDENPTGRRKPDHPRGRPAGRLEAVVDEVHRNGPGLVQVLDRLPRAAAVPLVVHQVVTMDPPAPLRAERRGWDDARAGKPVKGCPFRPGSALDQDYRQGHRRALEARKDEKYTPGPEPAPLPVGLEPKDPPARAPRAPRAEHPNAARGRGRAEVGRRRAWEAGAAARAARQPSSACPHPNPQGGYRRLWLAGHGGQPYPGGPDA